MRVVVSQHLMDGLMREFFAKLRAEDDSPRCRVTGNLFGTDTWAVGKSCACEVCQRELLAFNAAMEACVDCGISDGHAPECHCSAAIEKLQTSKFGAAAVALLDADVFVCPNCGEIGGTPVEMRGDECGQTGYVQEFSGCSLCAGRRA